jgi:hypothetical protein
MGTWALEAGPELIPVPIDPRLFKQLLAEVAEILLVSYRQLSRIEKTASQPIGAPNSHKRRRPLSAAEGKGSK